MFKHGEIDARKLNTRKMVENSAHMYAFLEFTSDMDFGLRHIFIDTEKSDFSWIDHTHAYNFGFKREIFDFVEKVMIVANKLEPRIDYEGIFSENYAEAVKSIKNALSTADLEVIEHMSKVSVFVQKRLRDIDYVHTDLEFLNDFRKENQIKLDYYSILKGRTEGFNKEGGYR